MEPKYLKWCKENMPERLFKEMEGNYHWQCEWRDREIKELEASLKSSLAYS